MPKYARHTEVKTPPPQAKKQTMYTRQNRQMMSEWSRTPEPAYQPAKTDNKAAAAHSVYRRPKPPNQRPSISASRRQLPPTACGTTPFHRSLTTHSLSDLETTCLISLAVSVESLWAFLPQPDSGVCPTRSWTAMPAIFDWAPTASRCRQLAAICPAA